MNVSYRWLQAIAPTITEPPHELAHRLAMLGAPVDEVRELGAGIRGVVIARVEEVRPHPNADRLRLCTVDAGTGQALQVVCGAPNVTAGGLYPFAPVGATLPGGFEIREAKLRGEISQGMLCSARELGLGRDHMGLMTLSNGWEPGTSFVEALELDDARLLVDVTANRPDLLCHLGVAREVAPGGIDDLRLPSFPAGGGAELGIEVHGEEGATAGVRVILEDARGCPRYLGAVIRGIRVGPSPEWLAARLRAVGLRPINNVVDATNYVLFELNQPLHAFDLDKLGDQVRIRRARPGERLRTLDGLERTLEPQMLVIADTERPVALAGVMGGEESEVTEETRAVFLECALFDPLTVRKAARSVALSTDSSYRFERGIDPGGQPRALRRVVDLILAVAGGEIADRGVDLYPRRVGELRIALRPTRIEQVLGISLSVDEVIRQLHRIGFEMDASGAPLRVRVPGYRPDVTREIDLIEEIARRVGYDQFPEELLPFRPSAVPEDARVALAARLREWFRGLGFLEARTVGFAPRDDHRVPLLNPLSAEESHLRDSLAAGLLRRVEHNWAHGTRDVRLFEIGTVFLPAAPHEVLQEEIRVAAAFTGLRRPPHWSDAGRDERWDLWDLKGLLEELAAELALEAQLVPESALLEAITAPETRLGIRLAEGWLGGGGQVAATAVDAPAWAAPVFVLEARLPVRAAISAAPEYRPIPEYPGTERDLALVTPVGVPAAEVAETIRAHAGALLEALCPFDVYEGAGLSAGERSVAWRLRFRAPDRTLTDAEVDAAVERVLQALLEKHGVRRR
jgi:phenylalanyl-tRNA synthetase beta chain